MNMTNRGEGWGGTDSGVARPTRQVLPIPKPGYPINDGQYAALARAFDRWKRTKGHKHLLPKDAYARWCQQVGVPLDDGLLRGWVRVPWHI
jgi:hypothetical protein